jgi:hypothetical protein
MQDCCPCVQLLVQVRPHMAFGALPVHTWGAVHGVVTETKRQPLASVAQVTSVWPFWHTLPARVQTDGLHRHVADVPETVHAWFGPHVVVVTHAVQPLACSWQVWTAPEAHCVAPSVHAFVQHVAEPAEPVHAPFVHVLVADAKSQVCASVEQVSSVLPSAHVGPAPVQTGSVLHVQFELPDAPVQLWWVPHPTGVP